MPLTFLKLGGSLITDKNRPRAHRPDLLARLAAEIAQARAERPDLSLLLGHGSGSFGHVEAARYGTKHGVHTPLDWQRFAEVWDVAREINLIVNRALREAGLPAMTFPPSASARVSQGRIVELAHAPIERALAHGLIPVVYGDVALDDQRGGTIISTEDSFFYLARRLRPARILLAGIENGVYSDYPAGRSVIPEITPANLEALRPALQGSASTDVTGGMAAKVTEMLALCAEVPGLEVHIFSGLEPGAVRQALAGRRAGTTIHG
ncbi:MAG: isopentenyl phosphate kinase family protein [Chloroflexi bacterium]|nr:isopentenyl phosphate kinase family protein [Chloroflexota bacterium]